MNSVEDAVNATGQSIGQLAVSTCNERYPKEVRVIDQFVERGATMYIVSGALKNKFGICVKSMWLIRYAEVRIHQRSFYQAVQKLSQYQ